MLIIKTLEENISTVRENILQKLRKSNKIGQDGKTLTFPTLFWDFLFIFQNLFSRSPILSAICTKSFLTRYWVPFDFDFHEKTLEIWLKKGKIPSDVYFNDKNCYREVDH